MEQSNYFMKSSEHSNSLTNPYKEDAINSIYNMLFCDDLELYKAKSKELDAYPWNIIFSDSIETEQLQKLIDDSNTESRMKVLAYNKLLSAGHIPHHKVLLAVIVEVGLDQGLDVLASYSGGTARIINQTEKVLIWETIDKQSLQLTEDLFTKSQDIVKLIGPWNKPRRPAPSTGNARISFLVSDGLYFGEGAIEVLFNDPLAGPALTSATYLMSYITEKSLESK
ncbi:MAG TPA: hypothetical protein PK006_13420 [Saprospiraceae bacterium]|nr:hypothetical protein [Saprospiraceae bacterium]